MWDFLFVIFCLGFLFAIFVWRLFRQVLSACCGFSSLLFSSYVHAVGFPACFSAPTPSFRSATYRLASGVGFSACFSHLTPTLWVSTLTFLLPRPVSAPGHIDQLPGWAFLLAFHTLRPRYGFPRLLFYFHTQFSLCDISISFRGGLFCLLFTPYAHAMGFPAYFSAPTPSFHSPTYRLASGVGFSACFSLPTPTLWVSPPTFLLPRPVSTPRHIDQLPGWAFLLAFHTLRPRRGFPRLLFCSHAQFPLRDCTISFRGGLFCLLFTPYAHAVVFPAYFSAPTPSFHSATYRLASGVGFSACFSLPTPTLWVSPPAFLLPRPNQYIHQKKL